MIEHDASSLLEKYIHNIIVELKIGTFIKNHRRKTIEIEVILTNIFDDKAIFDLARLKTSLDSPGLYNLGHIQLVRTV